MLNNAPGTPPARISAADLARLVVATRNAQREFFRSRKRSEGERTLLLRKAETLERQLDRLAADVLAAEQPTLLDEPDKPAA